VVLFWPKPVLGCMDPNALVVDGCAGVDVVPPNPKEVVGCVDAAPNEPKPVVAGLGPPNVLEED